MIIDSTVVARKILAVAPRWVRYSLVSSLIVGELLPIASSVVSTVMGADGIIFTRLSAVPNYQWEGVGIVLTMPVCFLWRTVARAVRGPTPYDKAEEYITVLKMAVAGAKLNQTQERMFWNAALSKLSAEFSVGANLPGAPALTSELQSENPISS